MNGHIQIGALCALGLVLFSCGSGSSVDLSKDENLNKDLDLFAGSMIDVDSLTKFQSEMGIVVSSPVVVSSSSDASLLSSITDASSSASQPGLSSSVSVVAPSSNAGMSSTIAGSSSSIPIIDAPSSSSSLIVTPSSSSIPIIPQSSSAPMSSSIFVIGQSSSVPLSSSVPKSSSSSAVVSSSAVALSSSSAVNPVGCTCDEGCNAPLTTGEETYIGGAVSRCFFRTTGYARQNSCDVFEVNGIAQTANVDDVTTSGIPKVDGGWYVFIKDATGCWFGVK